MSDNIIIRANQAIGMLEKVAVQGLDKVYNSHEEFLTDLVMSLPWDNSCTGVVHSMLGQPSFMAVSAAIVQRGGPSYYDYFQEMAERGFDGPDATDGPQWKTRF